MTVSHGYDLLPLQPKCWITSTVNFQRIAFARSVRGFVVDVNYAAGAFALIGGGDGSAGLGNVSSSRRQNCAPI